MARIDSLVFDSRHPASHARFWAAALDGYEVAPYDDAEVARLRAMGVDDTEDDPTVLVQGPPGAPRMFFQRVPESKTVKNRVHVDLRGADAEVARLVALGARVVGHQPDWVMLHDPEGNEFDLMR